MDGTPVNAATTNPAFIDANADDTGTGKYTLANTDAVSGSQIDNIQREHNAQASFAGALINQVFNNKPFWTNVEGFLQSQDLFTRLDLVSGKFNKTTGHAHTGADGDGGLLSTSSITGAPLHGYYNAGTQLVSILGGTADVTSNLHGTPISGNSTQEGLVVDPPYNKVILQDENGSSFGDGNGNTVYGRVTYVASPEAFTLTFYSLVAGVETAYSFTTSVNINWYYQQLYKPIVDMPVYSEFSQINIGGGGGGGGTGGPFGLPITQVTTSPFSINTAMGTIEINASTSSIVLNLPGWVAKTAFAFKRVDNVEANTVTIVPNGTDTIDGGSSYTLPIQNSSAIIASLSSGSWGVW